MTDHLFGAVELALVFGGALAWGVWEVRATRRARRESERALDAARRTNEAGAPPRD